MIFGNVINRLGKEPRKLFLIDCLGALLTAILLFVVLRAYHEFFGVAVETLSLLAGIAAVFCIYSASCFLFLKANWVPFIKAISFANLLYCMVTLGLVFLPGSKITLAGKIYFLTEILVVCGLVYVELAVAKAIKN
ncbi:hypothetical protein [Algoriphagus sp. A40]|uniref:hypothetical protein n=1 Tax=Algoriphagus sp. A40 TaxID=1945863 RepID=UPI000987C6E1|nr:hypothetical protein [Algoriphagus sp. A40]OOG77662.1 hypothetical protein B0E43_04510 [Algoriphagus sp. A40]